MNHRVAIKPTTVNRTSSRKRIAELGEDRMTGTNGLLLRPSGEEGLDEYSIVGAAIIVIAIMAGFLCAVILVGGAVWRWAHL